MLEIKFCLPRSVRVKLNSACQYKCKFCHQEGNGFAKDVSQDELIKCFKRLKKELGVYRIHFTGGEPTLYEDFNSLLKSTKKIGFSNSVTTNGQFNPELLKNLVDAGLDSVNFSIHSLEKFSFLKLQDCKLFIQNGSKWAQECIDKTINNLMYSKSIVNTKVNCVVGEDFANASDVLALCAKNNIKLRLLNDLSLGERSLQTINYILKKFDAELAGHEITMVSSSHRLDYRINDNYEFGVKYIRNFYLESLCQDCPIRKKGKCFEGFYGIRLEDKPLKFRLCLYRDGYPFVQSVDEFFKSKQFLEIKKDLSDVKKYLLKDDIIDEQRS